MKETSYLLQAALVCAWWVGLSVNESFFSAFQFDSIQPTAFWSFFMPDIVLIAGLSVLRAYQNRASFELVILGAFAYASLYCFNATLLTGSGWLPTGLMFMGLAYNVFLCFNLSLFRNSASTSFAVNASKTLIQIVCIWLIALVVIPYVIMEAFGSISFPSFGAPMLFGVAMFLAFSSLGLFSSFVMVRDGKGTPLPLDQTNQLVVTGPYRFVRNPMAVAGIGQGVAVATMFQSLPILAYAIVGAVVWHVVVRPIEERDMTIRFGEPYLEYRNRIKCWIPTLNGLNSSTTK